MAPGIFGIDGVEYGPNASGKHYKCLFYHRGPATDTKSTWLLSIPTIEEYAVFCEADSSNWVDLKGSYWGLRDSGNTPLGTKGERIAKFPANNQRGGIVPWHGYPASPNRKDGDLPPKELLKLWETSGAASRGLVRRLRGSKI